MLLLVPGASVEGQSQGSPHGDCWVMQRDAKMEDIQWPLAHTSSMKATESRAVEALVVTCPEHESFVEVTEIDLDLFDEASAFVAARDRHEFRVRWDDAVASGRSGPGQRSGESHLEEFLDTFIKLSVGAIIGVLLVVIVLRHEIDWDD